MQKITIEIAEQKSFCAVAYCEIFEARAQLSNPLANYRRNQSTLYYSINNSNNRWKLPALLDKLENKILPTFPDRDK